MGFLVNDKLGDVIIPDVDVCAIFSQKVAADSAHRG